MLTNETTYVVSPIRPVETGLLSYQQEIQGTLDPLAVEQRGFVSTGNVSARTDVPLNTENTLPIDTIHDWVASEANVEIFNLTRLYAYNGTFTEGLPGANEDPAMNPQYYPFGWNSSSYTIANATTQRSFFESATDSYAGLENEGAPLGTGVNFRFAHGQGSYVNWNQIVSNVPHTNDFKFSLDFLYLHGPLDVALGNVISLEFLINGVIYWNQSLAALGSHDTWFNSGFIDISIPGTPEILDVEIRLKIYTNLVLYPLDYGLIDANYLTVHLDNLFLIGETPPTPEMVSLSLTAGAINIPVVGSTGYGGCTIPNPTFWNTPHLALSFESNVSIGFDYNVDLLSHRFSNSSVTTDISMKGTKFNVEANLNPEIDAYTYIGYAEDYENMTLSLEFPVDYSNVSVYDPFLVPVTSQCITTPGRIEIPKELLTTSRLGWWRVTAETSNYAQDIATQISGPIIPLWENASVYRTTNYTRASITIGTGTQQPSSICGAEVSWFMPNQTLWAVDFLDSPTGNVFNSSQFILGSENTTAGSWSVTVYWNNGTEIAFRSTSFEVHHKTELLVENVLIETNSGNEIVNMVRYKDVETNEFIMDPVSTIIANWSGSTIEFDPNPIHNWWEANFNTSILGSGEFVVQVNASSRYYDTAECTFIIRSILTDNTLNLAMSTASIGIGDSYIATFGYSDTFGVGIIDAHVSIDFTGEAGGVIWSEINDLGNGNYSVEFTAVHSDAYTITISASRSYYEEAQGNLVLIVGKISTELSLENGTSAIVSYGEQYLLVLRYTNISGFGIDSAFVAVQSTTPGTGIDFTTATSEGNGFYSILLTPFNAGTYTLVITATLSDYESGGVSFTLTATPIATQLRIAGGASSASVGVSQPFEILVFYEQSGGSPLNISQATIHVNFTSYESLVPEINPLTEGYLIIFPTDQMGRYEFTIAAGKDGYQSDSVQFSLFVRERAMRVLMQTPIWQQFDELNISLVLIEVDTGYSVTGANVSYKLYRLLNVEMEGFLTETSPGVYSISLEPQWYDGTGYSIRIFAEKPNFALDQLYYEFQVAQTANQEAAVMAFLMTTLPPIGGIVVIALGAVIGLTVNKRRKDAEFVIDLANQHRFDDADNIIGVIVLHKNSGIPIYSQIVKGGFEEGIVAAFITAVSHFREEFEMFEEDAMKVIPISDIIRAVQTRHLICAFVTVRSASLSHNRMMESFGMQAGTYLDDFYTADTPPSAQDNRISEILNYVYDETMDGKLIKSHKIDPNEKLSKRYRPLEQVLSDMESRHCSKPLFLAKAVSKYGVSEARGCTLVSEAIEKRLIVLCEEHELPVSDIDLSKFLSKNGEDNQE